LKNLLISYFGLYFGEDGGVGGLTIYVELITIVTFWLFLGLLF
jgi:hypothetical protein